MDTDTLTVVISFTLDREGGRARFSAEPELEKVKWGTSPTLVWTLKAAGAAGEDATFAPQGGILFVPSARYPAKWPNDQPAPVPDSGLLQYSVEDPNVERHKLDVTYKYNVTVVANGTLYTWDPEEENEGDGGV